MGIFSTIMDKIFSHPAAQAPAAAPEPATADAAPDAPAPAPAAAAPAQVDVGAVLDQIASGKDDGGGNYQSSIVDLLKLLDMDSSLDARKQLADELNIHVADDGTAEENIALHKGVMDQLEANGGKIPDNLRH